MKAKYLSIIVLAGCLTACQQEQPSTVKDPITVASPQPKEQITKVNLTEEEAAYVDAGNSLTFKMLPLLKAGEESYVFSPLSLQYALGMTANGASGETLEQMLDVLGFGADIDKLNALCHKLLDQLPAVDLDVRLQLADAILVNERAPLLPSFKQQVEDTFYAAVENMSFDNPTLVANRINEWASRNTNGLIDKLLEESDISPSAIAFLMNALYFKAPWVLPGHSPRFQVEGTKKQPFFPGGCDVIEVPMMGTSGWFNYADLGNFRVLELPYAGGKFAMYILLPEGEIVGDQPEQIPDIYSFGKLLRDFPTLDWKGIVSGLKEREVILQLPRFETTSSYQLNEALVKLGMSKAFTAAAQFDRMFADPTVQACIDLVIQKARIAVTEAGTEAAAVTVVEMKESAVGPGMEPPVQFICNHPFAYLIAEKTSGVILFAGAYLGDW